MSYFHSLLALALATLLPPANAAGGDARAPQTAPQALFLALLAALIPLAALTRPATGQRLRHSPYATPYGRPGPRTARHRGPVPPRARRLGRFTAWWSRNRGARALPSDAPDPRPDQPARAPPSARQIPSAAKTHPQKGCASARPQVA